MTAALVMAVGLGAAAFVRYRHHTGHRAFRRLCVWYVGLLGVIAFVSRFSNVAEVRCRRDPNEYCRYNDSIPAIATIAVVFAIAGVIRARLMFNDR